jgi:hypothetical protein
MRAQGAIERIKRRLHCLHEEALRAARGVEHAFELRSVHRRGLFAEHGQAGVQSGDRVMRVAVLHGRDVDDVDAAREQRLEARARAGAALLRERLGRRRAARPHGADARAFHMRHALRETPRNAARAHDAPADRSGVLA